MRWLVEVTPMGKADTQSFCVEADSWQKALDAVRKHRGETPGMNGFSVELLEAGYRAVDPMARLKYVVRNAPAEMALTPGIGGAPAVPAAPAGVPKDVPSDAKTVPALDADDSGSIAAATGVQAGGKAAKGSRTSVKPPKAPSKAASAVTSPAIPSNVPRPPAPSNPGVLQMAKPVQRQVMIGAQGAVVEEVRTGTDPRLDPKSDPPTAVQAASGQTTSQPSQPSQPSQGPIPPPPPAAMPIPAALSSTSLMADASDPAIEIEIVRSEPPAKMAQTLANLNGQTDQPGSVPPPSGSGAEMIVTLTRSEPPAAAPAAPTAQAAPGLPAIGSPLPGLPNAEIIAHREQEPDAKSPIVYREISFALPPGTPDALAERVLTGQLEIVKRHIEKYTSRKFVNLAAFDVKFTGKPPVPPLVTITWKDWAGAPVIGYPRQGKKPSIVPPQKIASVPPPAFPAPTQQQAQVAQVVQPAPPPVSAPLAPHDIAPITQPMSNAPRPAASAAPAPAAASQAPQQTPAQHAPQTEPMLIAAAPSGEHTVPVAPPQASVAARVPAAAPAPAPVPTSTVPMQAPMQASQAPMPTRSTAPMHHADPFQADPFKAPAQPSQVPAQAAAQPPAQASQSQAPSQSPSQAPQRSNPPSGRHSRPSSPQLRPSGKLPVAGQRGRVSGDDLISALFEAMHDLHFLRDSLEGGDFCLALANEMMPSRVGLVHAYDINKRNFVVACAAGPGAEGLLTKRVADQDALLNAALRKRKSVVLPDAAKSGAPGLPRYQVIGGAKSIIVTPIMFGARALAVLELVDPMDGNPFTEDEGHAMNYIAEQFAEFIGSHGLVLETDKILAHHAQNAQQPGHHP